MENNELKNAIEALLFASERPLSADEIKNVFSAEGGSASGGDEKINAEDIKTAAENLRNEYETQGRGFRLFEMAGGYQLVSDAKYASYLKKFYQVREKKKLSQASLETLSVVAYRQPVTKAEIEFIRGVNVDGALKTLLEKGLVRIAGRKEIPGRPILYGTTDEFLQHFALNSLKDLPPLKEYTEKDLEEHLVPPELRHAAAEVEEVKAAEEVVSSGQDKAEEARVVESEGLNNERG